MQKIQIVWHDEDRRCQWQIRWLKLHLIGDGRIDIGDNCKMDFARIDMDTRSVTDTHIGATEELFENAEIYKMAATAQIFHLELIKIN